MYYAPYADKKGERIVFIEQVIKKQAKEAKNLYSKQHEYDPKIVDDKKTENEEPLEGGQTTGKENIQPLGESEKNTLQTEKENIQPIDEGGKTTKEAVTVVKEFTEVFSVSDGTEGEEEEEEETDDDDDSMREPDLGDISQKQKVARMAAALASDATL